MSEVLVALPFEAGALAHLAGSPATTGYAPTPELKDTFDLDANAEDEADRAALVVASVAALSRWRHRRVATALVRPEQVSPGSDRAHGEVLVRDLAPAQVVAWFADAPNVDDGAAADAAAGLDVDEAWSRLEVATLLTHDLLWHDAAEPDPDFPAHPRTAESQEDRHA